jgi:hypothetical protein
VELDGTFTFPFVGRVRRPQARRIGAFEAALRASLPTASSRIRR